MDQFINTIIWAAIFQGIVLGILYLFSKKHNSFANKLLGLFMFALVMEPIDSFLTVDYILGYANQGYFALPEVKILLPIFFLHFVLEKLGSSKRFIVFFKIHYGLAFIVIGITLLNILFHVFSGTTIHDHFTFRQIENVFYVQQYYAFVLTVVALITSVRETMKYRRLVLNEYSDITMLEINWLWQFILLIFPVSILWGTQLLIILLNGSGDTDLQLVIWAFVILFIYFSTYKAFQHKNLIEESDPKPIPLEDNLDQTDRKNESGDFGQELTENMQENRYYLNQDLTIYDLAK